MLVSPVIDGYLSPPVTKFLESVTSLSPSNQVSVTSNLESVTNFKESVTMPNPRIQFRIAPELFEQLPTDPDERSQFCLDAITAKLNPPTPDGEMGDLVGRLEILEAICEQFIADRDKPAKKPAPTDLDAVIDKALMQLRPAQRAEARKAFNHLRKVQASV